ncbi:MAG: GNAT family N-acetyltransferase [Humidesulfovibrio sp.]|nr:GNAT family N-acetyltransferase [Humidesulfovibrio sp.]
MIRAAQREDLPAILEIYNEAIRNTTAVYDYTPHTLAQRAAWYEQKLAAGYPLLACAEDAAVVGFATFGPFRAWAAYKYSVEHSLYVHKDHRRKGIGAALLRELLRLAETGGYATMIAGIDASNQGSRLLHEKFGFTEVGVIKRAGFKFGAWLDLCLYQCLLQGPGQPTED